MPAYHLKPLYFGPELRPLFGWLQVACDTNATPSIGLVLCNPFGYEAICAHRAIRHFTSIAAKLGIPSLRFDYDGTGDSAGNDRDPDRVSAWKGSINEACETLKAATGVQKLCILGIRLGATLATVATQSREDIIGLIAIAPTVKTNAYLRELRAMQVSTYSESTDELLEAAGFIMTDQTRRDIGALNVMNVSELAGKHLLIIDRQDFPSAKSWAEQLQQLGSQVTYESSSEYELISTSPHAKDLPLAMLRSARAWLQQVISSHTAPNEISETSTFLPRSQATIPQGEVGQVIEAASFLDGRQEVFAITCSPWATMGSKRRGIVLLNAGATHHIGPARLYTQLARSWAANGYTVMRLDICGIGDSPAERRTDENNVYPASAHRNVALATNALLGTGNIDDVIAIGLCAGAYHALKSALAGPPFIKTVLINPLTFFWKEGMSLDMEFTPERVTRDAERFSKNIFRIDPWKKVVKGRVNLIDVANIVMRQTIARLVGAGCEIARSFGFRLGDDLARELRLITSRGTTLHFIFSEGDPGFKLLQIQGGSTVARLVKQGNITIIIIKGADHTFTRRQAREQLTSELIRLIER